MLKTSKDIGWYLLQLVGMGVGVQIFLGALMVLSGGESSYVSSMLILMPVTITLFGGFINIYSYRMQLALSMGSTRHGFFIGTQLCKIGLIVAVLAIYVASFAGLNFLVPAFAAFPLEFLFLCFAALCLFGTVTELVGILIIVLGKGAYIIFMVFFMAICGILGAFSSINASNDMMGNAIAGFFAGMTSWLPFALLALSVLVAAINYLFVRKVTVKG